MRKVARMIATVDRIVDGQHAVLILGDPPERELTVPVGALPEGTREGHWLRVDLEGERLIGASFDPEATEAARRRVRSKMDRLRRRGRRLGGS